MKIMESKGFWYTSWSYFMDCYDDRVGLGYTGWSYSTDWYVDGVERI